MENSRGQNRSKDQHLDQKDQNLDQNKKQQQREGGIREDVTRSNADHNNASSTRGGTTDMNSDDTLRSSRSSMPTRRGTDSGITTKRNVTGSDYDGQVSEG
ncbi:MAG TPA: hypothetical protein VGE06_14175 [Flavisolibacter sp.]